MKHKGAVLTLSVALCLLLVPIAWGQFTEGNLAGTVEDSSGAAVVGAKVTVTSEDTGAKSSLQTDAIGYFRVQHLRPGMYDVRVEAANFKTAVVRGVVVTVNATTTADVKLQVGSVSESVEVSGAAALVQSDEARLSDTLAGRQVTDLPLNGREIYQLMSLQPGVTATNAPVISNVPSPNTPVTFDFGFDANGAGPRGNNFVLDGTSNNNDWLGGTPVMFPSPDAIQEFQVQTLNFSAEYGRNNGAVANVVTKSGTNDLHGSVYYFHRNTALNARNFFDLPGTKTPLLAHQFGFTFGGPIRKNKTFFFLNYDGSRRKDGQPEIFTVETPDFRQLVATQRPTSIANQFYNDFPAPPCLPGTAKDVGSIPDPGTPPVGNPLGVGPPDGVLDICQAQAQQVQPSRADQYMVRVDHNMSDRTKLFARWIADYASADVSRQELLGAGIRGFSAPLSGFFADLALGWTQQLSNTWINDFRFSYSRNNSAIQAIVPPGSTSEQQLEAAGMPNFFGHLTFNDGTAPFGGSVFVPRNFVFNTFSWSDTMSKQAGRHGLKWGAEFRRIQENSNYLLETHPYYIFNSIFNFANDQPWLVESTVNRDPSSPNFGHFTDTPRNFRRNQYALFFQDDWKVTSKLMLNLGMRWEVFGSPSEVKSRLSNIILGSGSTIFEQIANARAGRVSELFRTKYTNFAPRLGLAWDPFGGGHSVIRSGFSIAYLAPYSNLYTNPSRFDPPESSFIDSYPVFGFGTDINYTFPVQPSPDNFAPVSSTGGVVGSKVAMEGLAPNLRTAYSMQWFLGVQHEFMSNYAVSANYVGTRGVALYAREDWNRYAGDAIDFVVNGYNQDWGQIYYTSNESNATYHGVNAQLRANYNHGLMFTANYSFGKVLDLVSDPGLGDFFNVSSSGALYAGVQDPAKPSADWGPSEFDVRHRFTLTALWDLPKPKSTRGFVAKTLGGWQLNTIVSLQSGRPFDVFCGLAWFNGCDFNLDGLNYDRPNRPANVQYSGFSESQFVHGLFPVSTFCPDGLVPWYAGTPCVPAGEDGNLSRNAFRGPAFKDVDFAIFKNTNVTEKVKVQFRTEMFNLFNHTNLYQPQADMGNPLFGTSTQAFAPRQIQFGLKILF
jgi:Carboxypeptidase regulatory-like domain/TonB dependent receptor-like, beta-barrel